MIVEVYAQKLAPLFGDSIVAQWIQTSPVIALIIPYIPLIVGILLLIFVDVLKDVWRMYVGMFLEVITVTLYFLARDSLIVFAFINFIVIAILAGNQPFKYLYASIAWVRTFLLSTIVLLYPSIEGFLVFVPFFAIETFLLCFSDERL